MNRAWRQVTCFLFALLGVFPLRASEKANPPLDARSFANLMRQAQRGERRAQTLVGVAFAKGVVVAPNPSEAMRWFSQAAAAGDPQAQEQNAPLICAAPRTAGAKVNNGRLGATKCGPSRTALRRQPRDTGLAGTLPLRLLPCLSPGLLRLGS